MSLCDILYFVPVLPALSSLPTLPGYVLGRCQKKSGQGQQSQLALGQLTMVPASAALCADVGISRVHLNCRFMKTMRHKTRDWMTSMSRDSTILSHWYGGLSKNAVFLQ